MKFQLIGLLCAIMMTSTLQAQHVNIGLKGGLNAFNIDGGNFDQKLGAHFGLLGHVHLTEKFGLQPEIYYSMQGGKIGNTDNNLNLGYINVPVLLQYMFNNGFRLQAGPQLGILATANTVAGNTTVNVKDNYKNMDWGLGIGASYVHPPSGFGVDARYNHGLTNISENTSLDYKNRGFQLGVFYLFKHKH
ncbi:porin family protein [Mongoliibacter ruber]|uniref:Outer membrane protein with beta-barrel domain n=1 Tax=Mongoliibacter ruber TaxID=1750599 RepID=A0A2T0WDM9_9BACT|nr:porin family protein [Mongoliibacter ruber]PRY84775.1 outer membrane protein with beta-barrel domain [Mongoliibacter ruber]